MTKSKEYLLKIKATGENVVCIKDGKYYREAKTLVRNTTNRPPRAWIKEQVNILPEKEAPKNWFEEQVEIVDGIKDSLEKVTSDLKEKPKANPKEKK